jgi:hypothetical protein
MGQKQVPQACGFGEVLQFLHKGDGESATVYLLTPLADTRHNVVFHKVAQLGAQLFGFFTVGKVHDSLRSISNRFHPLIMNDNKDYFTLTLY